MKKDITVFFDVPTWQILFWIDFLNNKQIIPFLKKKISYIYASKA